MSRTDSALVHSFQRINMKLLLKGVIRCYVHTDDVFTSHCLDKFIARNLLLLHPVTHQQAGPDLEHWARPCMGLVSSSAYLQCFDIGLHQEGKGHKRPGNISVYKSPQGLGEVDIVLEIQSNSNTTCGDHRKQHGKNKSQQRHRLTEATIKVLHVDRA